MNLLFDGSRSVTSHDSRVTWRDVARAGHVHISSSQTKRQGMARAGPSRTQRSQRVPQYSQSQSQRPARGGRRSPVEDDEDENTGEVGEHDDIDMDINGNQGMGDAEVVRSFLLRVIVMTDLCR
jgi:hypothetical protein